MASNIASPRQALNGHDFRLLVQAGTSCMEQHVEAINALNVFPVPDGDTGTNMLLTLRAALDATEEDTHTVAGVSRTIARGAILGARGNSGVIFSQYLKGLASSLSACERCEGPAMHEALRDAAAAAYQAVGKPVEGTMLTVMRAAAEARQRPESSLPEMWATALDAAEEALIHTPDQLPVLKEAGVVDAGGQGIVAFMAGALAFLNGNQESALKIASPEARLDKLAATVNHQFLEHTADEMYGYCTQFVIRSTGLNVDGIREHITDMASSTVVVGDDTIIRVHAHTEDPGPLLSFGATQGGLDQVKIENMDLMHQEFMAQHGYGAETAQIAVVAVASGDGLAQVFRELGASGIVKGGQTMIPRASALAEAVQKTGAAHVILLPNNPNIQMAAQQACAIIGPDCTMVPTRTVPQGVAALLAFNPDSAISEVQQAMTSAMESVRSGEVTTADHHAVIDGMVVKQGQAFALLEGKPVALAETPHEALLDLIQKADVGEGALLTLYWGGDSKQATAETAAEAIRTRFAETEVELVHGGQAHYHYLVSIE